jgi:ubiquinone/menaquinone biosynthesis C-methylase UbiE
MQLTLIDGVVGTRVTPQQQMRVYDLDRQTYWEDYARRSERWAGLRRYYQERLHEVYALSVPPGRTILELGCGEGDLLHALKPSFGYGIDFSGTLIERARNKYPDLCFDTLDVNELRADRTFDVIIASDLLNDLWDVQLLFERVRRFCHADTRILLNCYSRLWEGPRRMAEWFGFAKPQRPQNWLTVSDISSLLNLSGFETVRHTSEIMCPVKVPLISRFCNRVLVKLSPFKHLGLTNFMVARPSPQGMERPDVVVTVVVAARNEAGNISAILDRVPELGKGTDLIFVEGNSSDDTYETIQREIAKRPWRRARLFKQTGKGKGDAVRLGFQMARGELLMILDADMTVPPEDLENFYRAWQQGKGDFINGVRLVYPMEDKAMRFFNLLGNKFFSAAFSWLLGQSIKDTLCGTKVLTRSNYEIIAANRAYFGEIDPFGDFDLIFGAARYNLKIVDLPIRYRERKYGETNIERWKHGLLLLRMVLLASRCIRFV